VCFRISSSMWSRAMFNVFDDDAVVGREVEDAIDPDQARHGSVSKKAHRLHRGRNRLFGEALHARAPFRGRLDADKRA
jgi:hypothetical protein